MPHGLPERIWPLALSRHGERLDGALAGRDLPRLRSAVSDFAGDVGVSLSFQGEGRECTVRGAVSASLLLCCQRCLGPMQWQAQIDVATRFVSAGALDNDSELESVHLDEDGSTSLRELIEDEVLLAMPQYPLHDEQDCPVRVQDVAPSEAEQRPNPFAVLADWKASD